MTDAGRVHFEPCSHPETSGTADAARSDVVVMMSQSFCLVIDTSNFTEPTSKV